MLTTKLLFATAAAAYDDEMFSRHPHFEVHAAAAAARKHWRSEKHVFCSHTHTRARAVGGGGHHHHQSKKSILFRHLKCESKSHSPYARSGTQGTLLRGQNM